MTVARAEPCGRKRFRADASPSRHGLLIPSPQAEPGVQFSRTGLPRCHWLKSASFRPSGVGFEQTAVGTTVDLSGASSSSGVADPDDSRRLSTGAVLAAVPS